MGKSFSLQNPVRLPAMKDGAVGGGAPNWKSRLSELGSARLALARKIGTQAASNKDAQPVQKQIAKIEPPGRIGDFYDFGALLGRGGFGTVSEILHARTFKPFAGKVLCKATSFQDVSGSEETFRKVMETLLSFDHAHVVKLLHVFEDASKYFVVMQLCQGGTVHSLVQRLPDPLPVSVTEDIIEQTASGLGALHALSLIHRDIKAENVMLVTEVQADAVLTGVERVKVNLVDFDLCMFLGENGECTTSHYEGTPGYLALEVLQSRRYSVRSDLFAIGCVLFYLLTKQQPCGNNAEFSADMSISDIIKAMDRWIVRAKTLCRSRAANAGRATTTVEAPPSDDRLPELGQAIGLPVSTPRPPAASATTARLYRMADWCLERQSSDRPPSVQQLLAGKQPDKGPEDLKMTSPTAAGRAAPREKEKESPASKASLRDLLRL